MALPSGTVTFLFTDIEGSTQLLLQLGDRYAEVLEEHRALLRDAIQRWEGREFGFEGDALFAAFPRTSDAVTAALEAQRALAGRRWPGNAALRVRMGLHTGEPTRAGENYVGLDVHRTARIHSAAHGGQILLSDAARVLVAAELPEGAGLRDLGAYRLKDLPDPEHLWQLVHPDLPAEFPPLRAQPVEVHNLPPEPTSFIGREQELAQGAALLLRPETRLLTLRGFGGLGKSRLAIQLARQCLAVFLAGVWWIALEQARTGAEMLQRLAEELPVTPSSGQSVREQVHHFLRDRELLLVLDCVEQIPDAAAVVRDLLAVAPGLRCVVTTRRALDLRGEQVLELRPMPAAEAEALFVERAQAHQPDFALTEENRADVAELCRRLEGVPHAIELAAARSVGLTPREMLSRLRERFRLLQSRAPDLAPRQRALYAMIDWSHDLLGEEEKALFAQLAVFAGGFTMEDAEAVCGGGSVEHSALSVENNEPTSTLNAQRSTLPLDLDVFEGVVELRRHSFLHVETDPATQVSRFLMLESLRAFAAEKLAVTPDRGEAVRLRHARHFLEIARERLVPWRTPEEAAALRALEQNRDNLAAAEQWARANGFLPLAPDLALQLGKWRQRRGFLQEAVVQIQGGIEALRPQQAAHPALAAELLRERAGLHLDYKQASAARACAAEALALCAALGDGPGEAKARNLLGQVAWQEEDYPEAREQFARALEQHERDGAAVEIAILRNNLGLLERRDPSGTPEEIARRRELAEEHLQEALRLRRSLEDRRGIAETLTNLGVLAHEHSNLEAAWNYYLEAIPYEQELGHTPGVGVLLDNLGEVALSRGDPERSLRLFAAAERLLEEAHSPDTSYVSGMLADAAAAAGSSPESLAALRAAVRDLPLDETIRFALAEVATDDGSTEDEEPHSRPLPYEARGD